MRIVRGVIIAACIAAIAFGVWKLYSMQAEYARGEKTYEKLEEYVSLPASSPAAKPAEKPKESKEPKAENTEAAEEDSIFPAVDFDTLKGINPDVIGWLYCDGTAINYPVVHRNDNDFYLTHMFDLTANSSGAIFLDKRNHGDFMDSNNIIYGHNMKNGSMFADLVRFKMQEFYEMHPQLLFMTPDRNYTIDVFAALVTDEWDKIWQIDFADDAEFQAWLKNYIGRSDIRSEISPTADDHVVTLSTCSYEYDGARYVVMGILKEAE